MSGLDVSFNFASSDVTATAGSDYTAVSGSSTISAGATSTTIDVSITDDVLDELAETFEVNLTNPSNATIADGTGVGTITDNDPPPTLSIDDVTVDEAAGTATFTVSLNVVSGQNVTFDFASSDVTATAGAD